MYYCIGPSVPESVTSINASMGPTLTSAIISFTVPNLSYTLESYIVQYGKNPLSLDQRSDRMDGVFNISLTNEEFNISVFDLEVGSDYYYRVLSSNSEGITYSDQLKFTAGKREREEKEKRRKEKREEEMREGWGKRRGGRGERGRKITFNVYFSVFATSALLGFENVLFQLKLNGVFDCEKWIVSES